ncbi:MAG: glycosyltransferase, partial [Marmoricola sp.]
MTRPPLVLVTVGSDHHPFDRLVSWIDAWLTSRASDSVDCLVQHGTSAPPTHARGRDFLPHAELTQLMQRASVIVTQGGPMSIVEARRAGTVPVVVPRESGRGEHVDDHQRVFARHMAAEGLARVPLSQQEFTAVLDEALNYPDRFVAAHDADAENRVAAAAHRVGILVDRMLGHPQEQRPRVLLIVGAGRSGSTLFERAVGAVPGAVPLGETVHLWERGVRDDELCGCGQPFSACHFWTSVGGHAFGGWDAVDPADVVALRHDVVRTRYLGALLFGSARVTWRLRRDRLARLLGALYAAAAEHSGATLLVDSSKMPAYAALLSRVDIDLRCVQVVRDPRGVAYSLSKVVQRPEVIDGSSEMPRYGAAESA